MALFQLSNVAAQGVLADTITAVTGYLVDTTLMLGKTSVPAPNKGGAIAQFTEADFDGYAAEAALVWGTPYLDVDGFWKVKAPSIDFVMTGTTILNTIYQAILTDAAKAVYKASITFESPIPLTAIGQGFTVVPVFVICAQEATIIDE